MELGHIPLLWEYVTQLIINISSIGCDYIPLTANYYNIISGTKEEDISLLKARGFSEEQIRSALNQKLNTTNITEINNIRFLVPTTRFKYSLIGYLLILLENYERGILPYPGSVSEQPAQVMEMITLLSSIKSEYQYKQQMRNKK